MCESESSNEFENTVGASTRNRASRWWGFYRRSVVWRETGEFGLRSSASGGAGPSVSNRWRHGRAGRSAKGALEPSIRTVDGTTPASGVAGSQASKWQQEEAATAAPPAGCDECPQQGIVRHTPATASGASDAESVTPSTKMAVRRRIMD